jgi:hypothetical protein
VNNPYNPNLAKTDELTLDAILGKNKKKDDDLNDLLLDVGVGKKKEKKKGGNNDFFSDLMLD